MGIISKFFGGEEAAIRKIRPMVTQINSYEDSYKQLTDSELRAKTPEFRERLKGGETLDDLLPEAFAAVREAAWRTIGLRHYDVQLIGGIVLHQGRIAEMRTGEGKTLVATLASYLNALSGQGVHIVTVNDYLAKRDAEWMGKVHRFLGLSVGVILSQMSPDQRRRAYASDITYGTNSEFGFDYLRDNMCVYKEQMVQRELNFAIVDEVDSILIDEARTPLIISGQGEDSSEMYLDANKFVLTLTRGEDIEEKSKYESMSETAEEAFANSGDYAVDPKHKTVSLTANGVEKAEKYFGIEQLTDIENTLLNHHIQAALKANAIFQLDIDYVIQDGEVMIVDEFTGRIMYGRRYNEGLHQAIEAKEGVKVNNESKTLATITYQNFFRMYHKLSGMTGTAKTEEAEFQSIYQLDVVTIPTNRPIIRKDEQDLIYMTKQGKYHAVVNEVEEMHKTGRPILIGTISVEISEMLSEMLKRRGIKHEVLNAKYHRKEAEIIAQAGKLNAVTIATNMAGRGTDILLGGNAEYIARKALRQQGLDDDMIEEATGHSETEDEAILKWRNEYNRFYSEAKVETDKEHEEVIALGGLHIVGTERHESRRIDNQLRGRAGRQGDPGSTRFYLSLEDDLLKLFGGDNIKNLAMRFAGDDDTDDTPMEMKMLTKQIENAQRRVESMHFESRKNVLKYDDVMNKQRETIYKEREQVLMGADISENIAQMRKSFVTVQVDEYCPGDAKVEDWDITALCKNLEQYFLKENENPFEGQDKKSLKRNEIIEKLESLSDERFFEKEAELEDKGFSMRDAEREIMLRVVDMHWTEHIDAMDQLRDGIGLQAYGNRDPAQEYAIAGFDMFEEMINSINAMTLQALYNITIQAVPTERTQRVHIQKTEQADAPRVIQPQKTVEVEEEVEVVNEPFVSDQKVGRNDPCPCGSGKKYKNCHGKEE